MNVPPPDTAMAVLEEMSERYFATPLADIDSRVLLEKPAFTAQLLHDFWHSAN